MAINLYNHNLTAYKSALEMMDTTQNYSKIFTLKGKVNYECEKEAYRSGYIKDYIYGYDCNTALYK